MHHLRAFNMSLRAGRIAGGLQFGIRKSIERELQAVAVHAGGTDHFFVRLQVGILIVFDSTILITGHVTGRARHSCSRSCSPADFVLPQLIVRRIQIAAGVPIVVTRHAGIDRGELKIGPMRIVAG